MGTVAVPSAFRGGSEATRGVSDAAYLPLGKGGVREVGCVLKMLAEPER